MPDPMWRRIAQDLRQKIESGELGLDGKSLPSELELRDQYEASRNTIRDAIKWLTARGLVVTRPGQGTFVVSKIDPFVTHLETDVGGVPGGEGAAYGSEVTKRSRKPETSNPRIEIQKISGPVAEELGLSMDDTIISRHQERFIDGTPWSLQTTFYPMRLIQLGATRLLQADTILPGAILYVEESLDIKRTGRRDRIKSRMPDRRETEFFALPDDGRVSVFEITQTYYDQTRLPFVVSITTYPADRNEFIMTLGDGPTEPPGSPGDQAK
jgi:GntR family transcriptional regulator